jgi:acyl-CoA hydrolase
MTQSAALRLSDYLRPDDLVVVEQGVGEPCELVRLMIEQRESLPGTEVFIGLSYAGLLTAEVARTLRVVSFGAMASLAPLAASKLLGVIPCAYADVSRVLEARAAGRVAVLIQVSPADEDGCHSLGVSVDYTHELLASARVVIAEVNDQMPLTSGPRIPGKLFTAAVHTSRALPEVPTPDASDLHRTIAASVAEIVPERATLQLGIGAVPSVVGGLLAQRRELRVHSALVGDWLLELAEAGALSRQPGSVVISGAAGSRRLYDYLAREDVVFEPIPRLSTPDVLAGIPRFVAMNSALQVDLSGQVNAELAGDRYLGGIGGQPDFLRGAQLSPGGRSIIVLPATAARGTKSRIVCALDHGVVTTARSGVDFVVTEFGVADLRGKTLEERAKALIAVAAPEHRRPLAEAGA